MRTDGSIATTTAAGVPDAIKQIGAHPPEALAPTTIDAGSDRLRVVAWPIDQDGRRAGSVVVWASEDPLEDFQRILIVVFGVAIPAIVALAISSAGFVTRRGLAPVRDIAKLATEIEAHDLSRRLRPHSEDDELGSLSATFDRMLDRLQAAFERQRRFTADASHELRAPLSVIRAEADLALARSRDPQEYRHALESIASEADLIEALIGDMLALARAEAGPPLVESTIDLAPLVEDAATRMSAVAKARGVRVEPAVDATARVTGDPAAIARVPLALVHNGVKYAKPGGSVRVSLSSNGNGEVRLAVRDDGPGFTPEGLRRATERFWKDDQGRGRDGSGLGLAIVRAIVEQAGGTLELTNAPGGGAEVVVTLPSAKQP
jgi:signal transduction histidine kinase